MQNIGIIEIMKSFYDLLGEKKIRQKLVEAGFSQAAISLWKHGKRAPTYQNAIALTKILNINILRIPRTRNDKEGA
jgi:transcriptional regulator with XRE-family HTH domain